MLLELAHRRLLKTHKHALVAATLNGTQATQTVIRLALWAIIVFATPFGILCSPAFAGAAGAEFRANTFTTSDQQSSAVAMDINGNYVIVWQSFGQDGSNFGIYGQRYNASGVPQGAEFQIGVGSGAQTAPKLAIDDAGNFVVVWTSATTDAGTPGIYAQRFTAAGVGSGQFQVNTTVAGAQSAPSVGMDAVGNFVVVWQSEAQDGSGLGIYAQRYNASAAAQGGEILINQTTAGDQTAPSIAVYVNGFIVAWESAGQDGSGLGIYARRFTAAGAAVGNEFRVNATTAGDQSSPSIACSGSGAFVIAWNSSSQTSGAQAQFFQINGTFIGSEIAIGSAAAPRFNPAVAIVPTFNSIVIASDDGSDVYVRSYSAFQSVTPGTEVMVNTTTAGAQGNPSISARPEGVYVVAWDSANQDGSGKGVYAQRFLPPFTAPTAISLSANSVRENATPNTVVATLFTTDNDIGDAFTYALVSGTGSTDNALFQIIGNELRVAAPANYETQPQLSIRVRTTDLGGLFFEGVILIDVSDVLEVYRSITGGDFSVNSAITNNHTAPDVAMDSNGNFVAVFEVDGNADGGFRGIFARRFTAPFTAQGNQFQVNTTGFADQIAPAVAISDSGNFVVVWQSDFQDVNGVAGFGIYGRLYTSSGTPVTGEFLVNQTTAGNQTAPDVAMDSNGNFVVVWQSANQDGSGTGVYARRYNSFGSAQAGEFLVNSTTSGDQSNPKVGMDGSGNFVVVWQSAGQDGDLEGIYARRYNSLGTAQGGEFLINVTTTNAQTLPAIAMTQVGSFTVAWQSAAQDGNQLGVYTRSFAANGTATSGEVLANTFTTGDQSRPAIASTGATFVAWQSSAQDGSGLGVYAQQFASLDAPIDAEFRANFGTSGNQQTPTVAMSSAGNVLIAWANDTSGTSNITAMLYRPYTAPTNINLSNASVAENTAANTAIGNLTTTDADAGDSFTYALVAGTGSTDNASFQIVGNQLRTLAALDFETKNSYSIRIRTLDEAGFPFDKAFTITVTNVNEAPTDIALSNASVPENTVTNTTIGSFSTTDQDVGNTFTYALVAGEGSTDNAAFQIVSGQLRTLGALDFETKSSYSIRVRSTDNGALNTEKVFAINVTNVNEAPTFLNLAPNFIPESAPPWYDSGHAHNHRPGRGRHLHILLGFRPRQHPQLFLRNYRE